ncbi:hypothetical protein [Flavobacterium acetivorans]|uniref:hypothetical protein n=1 Tax=Flavobacterium acetivorans TaxID=2893883 RepID=UPI001E43FDE0|nr:hypothetical protein [Flavobacterium sp. F-29]UFH35077.1 hypothetical protein LNP19_13440 [Flavobacterium sp. F-29]
MNNQILSQYHISFIIKNTNEGKEAWVLPTKNNLVSRYISDYFIGGNIEGFQSNILDTISRAQNGLPFDPLNDGSAMMASIEIGSETSFINDLNEETPPISIPTNDIKEIILTWIDWVTTNKLEKITV